MADLTGKSIGRYQVTALLGRGGMAEVYHAHDPRLGRDVAIKLILPSLAAEDGFERRFETEARALAALAHPHIVTVHDFGSSDAGSYLVMEFVSGGTLKDKLKALGRPLQLDEAARIVQAIGAALDHAHAKGVIHRDVKPANIMFGADGTPVLTDFGIARVLDTTQITTASALTGTPAYMAPEQANGQPVKQSDLYALAIVLFEMLTGRTPFIGTTATELVLKHLQAAPPAPSSIRADLPPGIDAFMAIALAKSPEARFSSGAELSAALGRVITNTIGTGNDAVGPSDPVPEKVAPPVPADRKKPSKSRARTATDIVGALIGRRLSAPEDEGVLGRTVTVLGGIGILMTALQFVLSSIETLSSASVLLVRYFPFLAIVALVAAAVVAVRVAWVSQRYRARALLALGAVALMGAGWAGWRVVERGAERDPLHSGPLVLIAQFSPCSGCPGKAYDRDVYNELLNNVASLSFPVGVKRLRASDHALIETSQEAQALGIAEQADIVIWGGYEPDKIIPHFELLRRRDSHAGSPGLDDLRSFEYKLSDSVGPAHAASVALGLVSYLRSDDAGMLTWFERAINSLPADQQAVTAQPVYFYRALANMRTGAALKDVTADLIKATTGSANVEAQHALSIAYMLGCSDDGATQLESALRANDSVIKSGRQDSVTYETRGAILSMMGQWREAVAAYEEALARGSTDPEARAMLAKGYRLLNAPDEAMRIESLPAASGTLSTTTGLPELAQAADAAWARGAFIVAGDAYKMAAADAVKQGLSQDIQAQLHFYAGLAYERGGDTSASIAELQASEQTAARHLGIRSRYTGSLHTVLGNGYFKLNELDQAIAAYDRALEIKPCDVEALLGKGLVLARQARFQEALPVFARLSVADPNSGAADLNIGHIRELLGSAQADIDAAFIAAEGKFAQQLLREPGNREVKDIVDRLRYFRIDEATRQKINQANLDMLKGDYASAQESAREAARISPDSAWARFVLGMALQRGGQVDDGLAELKKSAALDPERAATHAEIGSSYVRLKRLEDALAAYREATQRDATNAIYWSQVANLLWRLGRPAEAIVPAQTAVKLAPDDELVHGTLGFVLSASGNYTDALPVLARAAEISPTYLLANQQLAAVLYATGRVSDAVGAMRRVIEQLPDDGPSLVSYAFLLAEDKQARVAFEVAQRVLAEHVELSSNPYLRYALGVGYKAQGKSVEANAEFDAVLASGENNPALMNRARQQKGP